MTFKKTFRDKQKFKRANNRCRICGESKYELLDVHRIQWGGKYCNTNCVCLCTSCHRKVHSELIKIIGWFDSTAGELLLYIDEKGEEKFV